MRKTLLVCILLAAVCVSVFADESIEAVIKADIDNFNAYFNKNEYDKYLDMVYPKLFTIAPREEIKASIVQMLNSGMTYTTSVSEINGINYVDTVDGEYFYIVLYKADMVIVLSEGMEDMMDNIAENMKSISPGAVVTIDREKNTVYLKGVEQKLLAISNDRLVWKYLEISGGESFLEMVLPESVIEKL